MELVLEVEAGWSQRRSSGSAGRRARPALRSPPHRKQRDLRRAPQPGVRDDRASRDLHRAVLRRFGLNRLDRLHGVAHEHPTPGGVDVKKLGRIPEGGGTASVGARPRAPAASTTSTSPSTTTAATPSFTGGLNTVIAPAVGCCIWRGTGLRDLRGQTTHHAGHSHSAERSSHLDCGAGDCAPCSPR